MKLTFRVNDEEGRKKIRKERVTVKKIYPYMMVTKNIQTGRMECFTFGEYICNKFKIEGGKK